MTGGKRGRLSLRSSPRRAVLLSLLISSLFYRWLVQFPADRNRAQALTFLGIGTLLAAIGGVVLGRRLAAYLPRGKHPWGVLLFDTVLTGFAFHYFFTCTAGRPAVENALAGAFLTSLAIHLLAANTYLLGAVFLPGKDGQRSRRPGMAVALPYVAVLVAAAASHLTPRFWYVPLEPVEEKKERSFEEGIVEPPPEDSLNGSSPVHYLVELPESQDGVALADAPHSGTITIQLPYGSQLMHTPVAYDDFVVQDATTAVFPDGDLRFVGISVASAFRFLPESHFAPRNRDDDAPENNETPWLNRAKEGQGDFPPGFWRLDGTPMAEDAWPREWGLVSAPGSEVHVGAYLEARGDIRVLGRHELIYAPSGCRPARSLQTAYHWDRSPEGRGRSFVELVLGPPIPGPYELRIEILRGDERRASCPNRPGEVLRLHRSNLRLVDVYDGSFRGAVNDVYEDVGRLVDEDDFLCPESLRLIPQAGGKAASTAVFIPNKRQWAPERLRFEAVGSGGERVQPVKQELHVGRFFVVEFARTPESISEFRITERWRVTRIHFPVPKIPIFPEKNQGIDNLLDLEVPYPICGAEDYPGLRNLFDADLWGRLRYDHPDGLEVTPLSETCPLREVLDYHHPGRWRVRDGVIRITKPQRTVPTAFVTAVTGKLSRYDHPWIGP